MSKDHVIVKVQQNLHVDMPQYETAHSAGMDVRACLANHTLDELKAKPGKEFAVISDDSGVKVVLYPHGRYLFPTGLRVAIPVGYEIQVRPRSGLAIKQGISMVNTPGTIDADYRGEIGIILLNTSNHNVVINDQDRIAQLILAKVQHLRWDVVTELPVTERGEGGFGSTGK